MNFGPLEFANYLRCKGSQRAESARVTAARAAAPVHRPDGNRLTVVGGVGSLPAIGRVAQIEAVSVYEALAMGAASSRHPQGVIKVVVRPAVRPLVLVLSAHQAVEWKLEILPLADVKAVLLSGYGPSTVTGAGHAQIASIGGFYAFKRGSAEFKHLEQEVMRCTGRGIERFQSVYAGHSFEVGID